MSIIQIQRVLTQNEKRQLVEKLEEIGGSNIYKDIEESLLQGLAQEAISNKEFLVRYLLLAAILDQQADSESARRTVREIYSNYGVDFFLNPEKHLPHANEVVELALKTYKPKGRVLRMKKAGIILLRVGGYMVSVHNLSLRYGSLLDYYGLFKNPRELLEKGILRETMLNGLLYEKASRLYVGWITHPLLPVRVYGEGVEKSKLPMVVDGHVAKVMARAGLLSQVSVEDIKNMIIQAEKERLKIEREVIKAKPSGDPFLVDYGAFYIGIKYCHEEKPECHKCLINTICRGNIEIRAY
jgi:endonuclease III